MGAYNIEVMLHDEQVIEFIKLATEPYVRDGGVSDWEFGMRDLSAYIAQRFIDVLPELAAVSTATSKETGESTTRDNPLMPAYLIAKDAWLANRDEWRRREKMPFSDWQRIQPPSPDMPWIAVVEALAEAGLVAPTGTGPVAEPTTEPSDICPECGKHRLNERFPGDYAFSHEDWVKFNRWLAADNPRSSGSLASRDSRQCRECGCTDDDCSECIAATGRPCWWVEWDFCSRCEVSA